MPHSLRNAFEFIAVGDSFARRGGTFPLAADVIFIDRVAAGTYNSPENDTFSRLIIRLPRNRGRPNEAKRSKIGIICTTFAASESIRRHSHTHAPASPAIRLFRHDNVQINFTTKPYRNHRT